MRKRSNLTFTHSKFLLKFGFTNHASFTVMSESEKSFSIRRPEKKGDEEERHLHPKSIWLMHW